MTSPETPIDCIKELARIRSSLAHFCNNYGFVREGIGDAKPFSLWPAQVPVCEAIDHHRFVVSLKARQLGLTWIGVHDALRTMIGYDGSQVGVFSLREEEADKIVERVKFVYNRIPDWLKPSNPGQAGGGIDKDNSSYLRLSNGSSIQAFSTSSGDSYTFALVIVDEADLIPNLTNLLGRVRPTIDVGGRIHLISRANKELPNSTFKMIFRLAEQGNSKWKSIFLPWNAHPKRTQDWYEYERKEAFNTYGHYDYVYEQYPETSLQALAGASADKRIPAEWIDAVYKSHPLLSPGEGISRDHPKRDLFLSLHSIPGLKLYANHDPYRRYYIGMDPAEGNPTSDDSALVLIDSHGEETASLRGKLQPRILSEYAARLGKAYDAEILCERNNHGHACILALEDLGARIMAGIDGSKGWLTNNRGKAQLYSDSADSIRTRDCIIHTLEVATQLSIINGSTLEAPPGEYDDSATAFSIAIAARTLASRFSMKYNTDQAKPRPRPDDKQPDRSLPALVDSGRGYLGMGN